jgi:DNA-binding Lrp family transcriptional regulator
MSQDDIEALLKGTTWKVYKYILENGPAGIREIQKQLKLSTPSLAIYHLNKLEQEGIIKKDKNGYTAQKIFLKNRVKIRKMLIPRHFFYSLLIISALIVQLAIFKPHIITRDYTFSLTIMATIAAICLYETIRAIIKKTF